MKRAKRSRRGRGDNSDSGKGESQRASSLVLPLLRRFGRENVEKLRAKEEDEDDKFWWTIWIAGCQLWRAERKRFGMWLR